MRMFYEIRKPADLSDIESTEIDLILQPYNYKKEEDVIEFTFQDNPY